MASEENIMLADEAVSGEVVLCADDYTAVQLKTWLSRLDLPTQGTKTALVARLNEVSSDLRGQPPMPEARTKDSTASTGKTPAAASASCKADDSDQVQQQMTTSNDDSKIQIRQPSTDGSDMLLHAGLTNAQHTHNDNECLGISVSETQNNPHAKPAGEASVDLLLREVELLKLKIMLLEKEKELDGHQKGMEENKQKVPTENRNNANDVSLFHVAKEMLPNYNGGDGFNVWYTQLKNLKNVYKLDGNMLRMLILGKLKESAQHWLYSKTNILDGPVEQLLDEMEIVFGQKQSKLSLRKNFEARRWKAGENFITYFNDKMLLAADVAMGDDELVEWLIAGIPDEQLRVQAHIQSFQSTSELLKSFAKVQLGRPPQAKPNLRCYNCNSLGHVSAECVKPKREFGACYGCGSHDHKVSSCPQRRQTTENYNAS